jgi:hypothetical protein
MRISRRTLSIPAVGPRGRQAHGVIVVLTWGAGTPDFACRNPGFCPRQKVNSRAVALDMKWRDEMSEGGPMGRSGNRLGTERNLRGCLLWFDRPIGSSFKTNGLSARIWSKLILISSPSSGRTHNLGTDGPGLALLIRGKQRMPGNWDGKVVTARRILNVRFMGGSALRTTPGPNRKIHERNSGSLAHGRHGSCRYW